jgi:toxin ParE1/3/4
MSVPKATIVLNPAARRDIRSILVYTRKQWGQDARAAYEEALDRALMTMSENPRIGRAHDEIIAGLRSLRVRQHVIYYQVVGESVTVFRVLHGKMDAVQHIGEI